MPIFGWGINDVDGFLANHFRLLFIVIMAALSLWVVIFVPNEGRGYGAGDSKKIIKRQKLTILTLQITTLLIVIISPHFDRYHFLTFNENSSIRVIGLMLTFIGFLLMNWSISVLGKQFSVNVTGQKDHKLITKGPYKYIRHPRYLGIIVFLGGIPLTFLSTIPLILDFIILLVLLWRIKDEEILMNQEFKQEWKKYSKTTYSLIPFVY